MLCFNCKTCIISLYTILVLSIKFIKNYNTNYVSDSFFEVSIFIHHNSQIVTESVETGEGGKTISLALRKMSGGKFEPPEPLPTQITPMGSPGWVFSRVRSPVAPLTLTITAYGETRNFQHSFYGMDRFEHFQFRSKISNYARERTRHFKTASVRTERFFLNFIYIMIKTLKEYLHSRTFLYHLKSIIYR